jgi:hypothetical protein
MSDFTPNKLDENKINLNSGKKFNKGDAIPSDDLNSIIEGILYNNENQGQSGDFQPKYDETLKTEDKTIVGAINKNAEDISRLTIGVDTKQDQLIAGENITIEGRVISASGGGSSVVVDSELSSESENPVQNKVINEALGGKLDKITDSGYRVYVSSNGVNRSVAYGDSAVSATMPVRDSNKTFRVGEPTNNQHPVTLGYFNSHIPKLYKHSVAFSATPQFGEAKSFDCDIISLQSTIFTQDKLLLLKGQTLLNLNEQNKPVTVTQARAGGFVAIDDNLTETDYALEGYFDDIVAEYKGE